MFTETRPCATVSPLWRYRIPPPAVFSCGNHISNAQRGSLFQQEVRNLGLRWRYRTPRRNRSSRSSRFRRCCLRCKARRDRLRPSYPSMRKGQNQLRHPARLRRTRLHPVSLPLARQDQRTAAAPACHTPRLESRPPSWKAEKKSLHISKFAPKVDQADHRDGCPLPIDATLIDGINVVNSWRNPGALGHGCQALEGLET